MLESFHKRVREHHSHELKILLALEIIMVDLSNLNAAVAANTAAVSAVAAEVALLNSGANQAAIDAAATQITTNNAALNALVPPPVVTPPSS